MTEWEEWEWEWEWEWVWEWGCRCPSGSPADIPALCPECRECPADTATAMTMTAETSEAPDQILNGCGLCVCLHPSLSRARALSFMCWQRVCSFRDFYFREI